MYSGVLYPSWLLLPVFSGPKMDKIHTKMHKVQSKFSSTPTLPFFTVFSRQSSYTDIGNISLPNMFISTTKWNENLCSAELYFVIYTQDTFFYNNIKSIKDIQKK